MAFRWALGLSLSAACMSTTSAAALRSDHDGALTVRNSIASKTMVTTKADDAMIRAYWTPERIASLPGTAPYSNGTNGHFNTSTGQQYPYGGAIKTTVGRIVTRQQDAQNGTWLPFSCTGTLIESENQATVVTAGHCVYAPNGTVEYAMNSWSDYILWIPGYDDGKSPYGSYTVQTAMVDTTWQQTNGFTDTDDRAYMVLNNDLQGRAPGATLGAGQHIAFNNNTPRVGQSVWQLGWPRSLNSPNSNDPRTGTPAFSGRTLASCNGSLTTNIFEQNELGTTCYMGAGCSGGPAFIDFNTTTGRGTVVGINTIGLNSAGPHDTSLIQLFATNVTSPASEALWKAAQSMKVAPLT